MKKGLSSMLILMILLMGQNVAWAGIQFTDLEGYGWAEKDIASAVERGVVAGVGNGRFEPARMVSREEFARMIVATFDAPLLVPANPTFSDVSSDHWSYPAVETAKDFLTGYSNPFGGLPAFHPTEPATREDIAVALVKIMGLSPADAKYQDYALYQFPDANDISPGLLGYINVAAEQGLIAGKGDGRFDPQGPATRAETVVLINRATKNAVADLNKEVPVDVQVAHAGAKVTLYVTAAKGATVTVDGQELPLTTTGAGDKGSYSYTFLEEGSKTFTVEATKLGKTTKVTKTVTYQMDAPILKITDCPTTSNKDSAIIRGVANDPKDKNLTATINGVSLNLDYAGNWSYTVALKEGENTFEIVAKNSNGKTTVERKTIVFQTGGPVLTITDCPSNVDMAKVRVSGRVSDLNDSNPTLTINGKSVVVDYGGYWSETVALKEGRNTLTITAKNKLEKTTTENRTVEFATNGPTLEITNCPINSEKDTATISGRVRDVNDNYPSLTINGRSVNVDYGGYWSYNATLKEGNNSFEIIAKNKLGKTAKEVRTIELLVGGPVLDITNCPINSDQSTVTISGRLKDTNDQYPSLTINGRSVNVDYGGYWSYEVTLTEGNNNLEITGRNKLGKTTTETRTIEFLVSGPVLDIINCPQNSDKSTVTISGRVRDTNDKYPTVTINGSSIGVDYSGYWSYVPTLQEGSNSFEITAKNKLGKTTTETRIIEYQVAESGL